MLKVYLSADLAVMAAYALALRCAWQYRVAPPVGLYTIWCLSACLVTCMGYGMPEFRAEFFRYGLAALMAGWALFVSAEVARLHFGLMTPPEAVLAAALVAGTLLSLACGVALSSTPWRLGLQTAAVVAPILMALIQLGPTPDPAPVGANAAPVPIACLAPAICAGAFQKGKSIV